MNTPLLETPYRAVSLALVAHLASCRGFGSTEPAPSVAVPMSADLRRRREMARDRRHDAEEVSERIKAQRENTESRRIFDDLFANSDAAIIDHDFSLLFRAVQALKCRGVRNFRLYIAESDERLRELVGTVRVNNANAAALRMLGVSCLPDIVEQLTNIVDIAEAIFLGVPGIKRSEYLVAGGTPIPVVYSLRIPKSEEDARRVPIVIMDLSDVRLAEAARQATLAKSQFLSSMSHEIRTPLNGVIGNLELLALTALDSEQFELIDDADKAAKALLGLVGNILDFSKIEAGKLTTEMGDVNPAALVEEAVDVLQTRARQKKLFIAATFRPDVPSLVRGDALRIRQILLNLIGNSVKFTDRGGVHVKLKVTRADEAMCELRFEVHDSGRGFDQSLAARLFEPFTQKGGPSDGSEGTGLGLSISKSLVAAFGGTIGCDAVPGEGATFWFTLPAAIARRAPPPSPPDLSGLTVAFIAGSGMRAVPLEDYFRSRGAAVVAETGKTFRAFALDRAVGADVAVLVAERNDDDASEAVGRLRDRHIVPLLFGTSQSEAARLRQGFAAVISPATSVDLLDCNIRLLTGHAPAHDRLAAQHAAFVQAIGPAIGGSRVLVLEDRLVNQTVIRKQLKKLGINCVLVANGALGLEALTRQEFDLVLCDCSMPEMNGYDFTRALRHREAETGGDRRLPVIALTANAFREDADKCREAGMDDFISKPVTMDRLAAVLVRWLTVPGSGAPPAASGTGLGPMIDLSALSDILGSDEPNLLNQVLAEFLAAAGASLSDVESAVATGDPVSIKSAAHGAKGEARCAAATALSDLYAELDRTAKDGDRVVAQRLVARAATELCRVEDFIRGRLANP
jgi:signal transduction histidine kinase/CheY-like chemotaxis protein